MKNFTKYFGLFIFAFIVSCSSDDDGSHENPDKDSDADITVTTSSITELTAFSASSGGEVKGNVSISERGICWDTNESPKIENSDFVSDIETVKGKFTLKMNELVPDKTYYVRAYAKTVSGETFYGESISFTTKPASQSAESNSYLVEPNSIVMIPVSRANKSQLGNQISSEDALHAELIWMDNLDVIDAVFVSGNGETGSVVVSTGEMNGNAVVAVNVNGKTVWSWHIWVTEDANSIKSITMPSGAELMDRNLGATSMVMGEVEAVGMQYQFGRKDPFVASASFGEPVDRDLFDIDGNVLEIDLAAGPMDLAFATANPISFITRDSGVAWHDEDIRDWWNTSDGSKSVYDPSPEGWKVASLETYADISDDSFNFDADVTGGQLFVYDGQSNYWPFTGYREFHGLMDATGNYGTFWTSEAIDDPAAGLNSSLSPTFGLGGTAAVNGAPKARALSIRCVRE